MAKAYLALILAFSVLLGIELNLYHLRMPEVRFTFKSHLLCLRSASTYYVPPPVPEVRNVQKT